MVNVDSVRVRFAMTGVLMLAFFVGSTARGQSCPATTDWVQRAVSGPGPRAGATMAYDTARHRTVLFGGSNADGYFGDTWEWDGSVWLQRSTTGPSARSACMMAWDGSNIVLFGGGCGVGCWNSDTWTWDGTSWTQRSTPAPGQPIARAGAAMVYDSVRGRVVMFGGYGYGSGFVGDTWEWDGSGWLLRATTGPSARYGMAAAYDSARQRTIVFGGNYAFNTNSAETWGWNGSSWTRLATTGPSARYATAAAYDSVRQWVYLFGGTNAGGVLGDAWVWNGSGWSVRPGALPAQRASHAMEYDAARERVVLYGGGDNVGDLVDTWEAASCPHPGACCGGTTCVVVFESGCVGAFQGESSTCGTPGSLTICCRADYDHSGTLGVQDIFAFLSAWFASDPRANWDGVNGTNVTDIFSFMDAWFTGC